MQHCIGTIHGSADKRHDPCDGLGLHCPRCRYTKKVDRLKGTSCVLAPSQQQGSKACMDTLYRACDAGRIVAAILDNTKATKATRERVWMLFDRVRREEIKTEHINTSAKIRELEKDNTLRRDTKEVRGHPTGAGDYIIIENVDGVEHTDSPEALATRERNSTKSVLSKRRQMVGNVDETGEAVCAWHHTSDNGYTLVCIKDAVLYTGPTKVDSIGTCPNLLIALFPE